MHTASYVGRGFRRATASRHRPAPGTTTAQDQTITSIGEYTHAAALAITRLSALALGIAGALTLGQVHASGFQLKENSVKAIGRAFAGAGVASDDASVVANNPATMARFDRHDHPGRRHRDRPQLRIHRAVGTDALGRPLTGGNGGDAGDIAAVPAMSVIHKLDNGLAFGAMISAPFGLKTEYDNDWAGRYFAHKSDVEDRRPHPGRGARHHAGPLLGRRRPHLLARRRDPVQGGRLRHRCCSPTRRPARCRSPAFAAAGLPTASPRSRATTPASAGPSAANFDPTDKLAIGLSYRSEIDYELDGTADWTVPGNVAAVFAASPTTRPAVPGRRRPPPS